MNKLQIIIRVLFVLIIAPLFSIIGYAGDKRDTTVFVYGTKVDIKFPQGAIKGAILVLPGWNFMQDDICIKSDFCEKFTSQAYVLVMPNMLKSVYSNGFYEETRADWRIYPQLHWVIDSLLPYIHGNYNLMQNEQVNFIFGISTGGRGVALVLEHSGMLFKAGAALSGDYNQLLDFKDNLMIGYYGIYSTFPERWKGEDNPYFNAAKIKCPIYLAHGKADKIVPVYQTIKFYEELTKINPQIGHKLKLVENAGHNYNFWNSEYDNVLNFFNESLKP